MPVTYDFHGQVAIVTGGASGIGRAIAEHLRDANAKVFVWDLREPGFDGVSFSKVDVSVASSIEQGLAPVTEACGTIEILVNNAGFVGTS
jgi:3-oxoacyl-[acyl-carrier protein] reductase